MAGFIRNLKNPFTGKFIFPVTKTRAVYDDNGNRLDYYLESMKSISGNNLLINSNFANPVNQRGVTFPFSGSDEYFIDRWWVNNHINYVKKTSKGIMLIAGSVSHGLMKQTIEDNLIGQCVTLSAKIDGKILQMTCNITADTNEAIQEGSAMLSVICDGTYTTVDIIALVNTSIEIEWIKLEYGKAATPYAPRLYAEELQLCKRYYQTISLIDMVYAYTADLVYVRYATGNSRFGMRTVPTVLVLHSDVYKDGSHNQGFNFSVFTITSADLILKGEKTAHGLTTSNILQVYSELALDAEL